MVCNSGKKYVKHLDIIRKCGCTKKCNSYWLRDAATPNKTPADIHLDNSYINNTTKINNSDEYDIDDNYSNDDENIYDKEISESGILSSPIDENYRKFDFSLSKEENEKNYVDSRINVNDKDEYSGDGPVVRSSSYRHYFDDDDDNDNDEDDEGDLESRNESLLEKSEIFSNKMKENVNKKFNEDDSAFSSIRHQKNNKLRKTDAIKIISTPQGKVRIVYETSNNNNKESSINTDELQKDVNSKDSAANEAKPKISPVLVNGTVAILYRGEVSNNEGNVKNNKYMPITSITNFNNQLNRDNKNQENKNQENTPKPEIKDTEESYKVDGAIIIESTIAPTHDTTVIVLYSNKDNSEINTNILFKKNDNSVLPIIDRPLSEVLGIKKNQFTSFRISDTTTLRTTFSNKILTKYSSNSKKQQENLNDVYDYDEGVDETINDYVNNNKIGKNHDTTEISIKTELVNLAIIPSFDNDLERNTKYLEKNYRNRGQNSTDLSAIHCAMQAMVAFAAVATVLGILGAYFKTRILDQLMIMHW